MAMPQPRSHAPQHKETQRGEVTQDMRGAFGVSPLVTKESVVARKNVEHCHFQLTADENDTVDIILSAEPSCDMLITPTHRLDNDGIFSGFRVCYPPHTAGVQLPVNRKMFFGTTITEASSQQGINPDVIALVQDRDACRKKIAELMRDIDEQSKGHEASLECLPLNVDVKHHDGPAIGARDQRAVDSKPWRPEVPDFIGIYHTYTRGHVKDSREHRLYIACGGGCTLASEDYYNMLLDTADATDVDEIVDSEETWWLRNAAYRARCRILFMLAEKFGLAIPTITDMHAYDDVHMARGTTNTVANDVTRMRSGHIAVFNNAVDTTTSRNGIISVMHPAEGLWVFKGPVRSNCGMSTLGSGFGDQRVCGVFPTGTYPIYRDTAKAKLAAGCSTGTKEMSTVLSRVTEEVVCYRTDRAVNAERVDGVDKANGADKAGGSSAAKDPLPVEYLWFDEAFIRTLEGMGYDRNCGILELMPIVVAVSNW